ncbi:hypothetical protein IVA93_37655 (plasmid) [Bradyrhizobium sp. 155]|uniref:hypothetical protein n=1 Tax=Bradyrhizobium sp. 155 TaxID=2782629 RepID=UPI001FFF5B44|nr:hypothetical protein [Bradyrhizobium sp. 155]UPK15836.1 hypothetical protein IVA93_37655 [Bradyrhizobium sp. 155]
MARFWEVLTLIGFLLMSGELVIQDKAKLNNRWHGIMTGVMSRFPFNRVGGPWRRWARDNSLTTVFMAVGLSGCPLSSDTSGIVPFKIFAGRMQPPLTLC